MKPNKSKQSLSKEKPDAKKASGFFVGNNQRISFRFGLAVRIKREELCMTQTDLARISGLNRSFLSELEHGLTNISLERADRIARALNCKLCDLLS